MTESTTGGLSPVQRDRLSDRIYDEIRRGILRSDLASGERLVESDIARQMGVSQSPVRDAFKRLVNDGLVTQEPRRGTFVSTIDEGEARRVYSARELLDPYAASEFLAFDDGKGLARLEELVEQMFTAASNDDLPSLVIADVEFHRTLYEGSQHPLLVRVWPSIEKMMRTFTPFSNRKNFPSLDEVAATHVELLDALRDGDARRVAGLFQGHSTDVWARIAATAHGDLDDAPTRA